MTAAGVHVPSLFSLAGGRRREEAEGDLMLRAVVQRGPLRSAPGRPRASRQPSRLAEAERPNEDRPAETAAAKARAVKSRPGREARCRPSLST